MIDEGRTVEQLGSEVADLRQQLRRSELRLAGARAQLDLRLASGPRPDQLGQPGRALLARAEAAEASYAALLGTRTFRLVRVPRALYAMVRTRIAARRRP